jgi:hypothetical protein
MSSYVRSTEVIPVTVEDGYRRLRERSPYYENVTFDEYRETFERHGGEAEHAEECACEWCLFLGRADLVDVDDVARMAVELETTLRPWARDNDLMFQGVGYLCEASRLLRRGGVDTLAVAGIIERGAIAQAERGVIAGDSCREVDRLMWELVAAILARAQAPRNRAERRAAERRTGRPRDRAASLCPTTRADSNDDDRGPAVMVRGLVAAGSAPPRLLPV